MISVELLHGFGGTFGRAAPVQGVDKAIRDLESFLEDLAVAPAREYLEPGKAFATMIHVPAMEDAPFGRFAIELTQAEAAATGKDIDTIIKAIGKFGGTNVRRMLIELDARPPLPDSLPDVKDFVRKSRNLIDVYRREVERAKVKTVTKTVTVAEKTPGEPIKWWLYAIPAAAVTLLAGAIYVSARNKG